MIGTVLAMPTRRVPGCDGSDDILIIPLGKKNRMVFNAHSSGGRIFVRSTGNPSSFVDAATIWWGKGWRTPTYSELNKFCQTDSFTWEWDNSIKCYKVTCKANNNSILLPAAGYRNGTTHDRFGTQGFYWSSELYGGSARFLYFNSANNTYTMDGNSCYYGQPIRPIVAE